MADIIGYPFVLPLVYEVTSTILIIARAIIDKQSIELAEDKVNYVMDNTEVRTHVRHLSSGGSGFGSISPSTSTSNSSGFKTGPSGEKCYGGSDWHLTPPIPYILATGLHTDLRILEFIAAVYGVAWEDLWLNTVVFCGAVCVHFHPTAKPLEQLLTHNTVHRTINPYTTLYA